MNWLKYKKIYFSISSALVLLSVFSLINWGLPRGVDFSGGTVIEYRLGDVATEMVASDIEALDVNVNSVQRTSDGTFFVKAEAVDAGKIEEITQTLQGNGSYENIEFLRAETVGPSIGPELIKKTYYAISLAALSILLWIAYQFKSIIFGASAILAMFHDTFILIGSFALLGYIFNAQVDFLFVTAVLTTLSFSVHDTIVVFDRIREIRRNAKGELEEIANKAISETMVRSLNNSFTIIFMLVALVLLGGITVRWFAVALLIGTVLGTYSSPFVAVPILVTVKEFIDNMKTKESPLKSINLSILKSKQSSK